MLEISDITGKTYDTDDVYYFRNYVQAAHYLAWSGVEILVDLFVDSNKKLVFVFPKKVHEELKYRWMKEDNEYHTNKLKSKSGV